MLGQGSEECQGCYIRTLMGIFSGQPSRDACDYWWEQYRQTQNVKPGVRDVTIPKKQTVGAEKEGKQNCCVDSLRNPTTILKNEPNEKDVSNAWQEVKAQERGTAHRISPDCPDENGPNAPPKPRNKNDSRQQEVACGEPA